MELFALTISKQSDLSRVILEHRPQILHIPSVPSLWASRSLLLEGDDGQLIKLTPDDLRNQFRQVGEGIRLIVFGRGHSRGAIGGFTLAVDCVIGLGELLNSQFAAAYAGEFYRAIGEKNSIAESFELAYEVLSSEKFSPQAVPFIIVRPGVDAGRIILAGGMGSDEHAVAAQADPPEPPASSLGGERIERASNRSVEESPPRNLQPATAKLKVLFLTGSLPEGARWRPDEEYNAISGALADAANRGELELIRSSAKSHFDLLETILEHGPQVVHVASGLISRAGEIMLEEDNGRIRKANASLLASELRAAGKGIRVLIVGHVTPEIVTREFTTSIDCVISLDEGMSRQAAVAFAGRFYQSLIAHRSVAQAFRLAKHAVRSFDAGAEATPLMMVRPGVDADRMILTGDIGSNEPAIADQSAPPESPATSPEGDSPGDLRSGLAEFDPVESSGQVSDVQAAPVDDWVGQTLSGGRYRVDAKISESRTELIYKGWDRNLNADVAIKAPRKARFDDPTFARRFTFEIRSLAMLSHPNIVKAIDLGELDGLPFAVMPYLSGGTLAQRLVVGPEGHRLLGSVMNWLPGIAAALDFIHANGYIHRNVKPTNILFDAEGRPYLIDFGIAKVPPEVEAGTAWEGSSRPMEIGSTAGTPAYMAPELFRGDSFDGKVDQYALAVTAYKILCGREPFSGGGFMDIMRRHSEEEPPPMDELPSSIRQPISSVIFKALAKKPNDRFRNCVEFANALALAALVEVDRTRSSDASSFAAFRNAPGLESGPSSGAVPDAPRSDTSLVYTFTESDGQHRRHLEPILTTLLREGLIADWRGVDVGAARDWTNLESARIVLLLVSHSFLTAGFIYSKAMAQLLDRHEEGEARVISILVEDTSLRWTALKNLPMVPADGRSISDWSDLEKAWSEVAEQIRLEALAAILGPDSPRASRRRRED